MRTFTSSHLQMVVLVAITVAASATPRPALACGALPTAQYTITALEPGDGATGVARDTGFIIHGVASTPSGGPGFPLDVRLIDVESGLEQPLRENVWYSQEPSAAWYPRQALLPLHAYRLEARSTNDAAPLQPVVSTFTTGEALLEPLSLEGEIQVSLEGYDEVVQECTLVNDCGVGSCFAVGTRPALRAKLDLPAASGGQLGDGGYRALLYLTDDTPPLQTEPNLDGEAPLDDPHEVNLVRSLELEPNQRQQLELEIVQESFAYAPCFTWVVWDPAGHRQKVSKCLPSMSPAEVTALAGSQPAAPTPNAVEDDGPSPPQDVALSADDPVGASSGCAVVAGHVRTAGVRGRGVALLGLLGLLVVGARRSRR